MTHSKIDDLSNYVLELERKVKSLEWELEQQKRMGAMGEMSDDQYSAAMLSPNLLDTFGMEVPILSFKEESPYFHADVSDRINRCEQLSKYLKTLLDTSRKWRKKAKELQEAELNFANALDANPHKDLFGATAVVFGNVLRHMAQTRESSMNTLETSFVETLEQFHNEELGKTTKLNRAMNKAHSEYMTAMSSFLNAKKHKHNNKTTFEIATKESMAMFWFEQYELSRLDLISQLNQLEMRKQSDLAGSMVRALFAIQSNVRQNHERLMESLPGFRALQHTFPTIDENLAAIENQFDQIRFDLCRTLCRSVKVNSRPLTAEERESLNADSKGQHHGRHSSKDIAFEFVRRFGFSNKSSSASSTGSHGHHQSQGHGHCDASSASDGLNRTGDMESERKAADGAHPLLTSEDSFILLKKSPTLNDILKNRAQLAGFLRFVVAEKNTFHIAFWLEVENFHLLDSAKDRQLRAEAIVEKYLTPDLLLSDARKSELKQAVVRLNASARTFFDQAQGEVLDIISAETLTRFLRSEEWINCRFCESSEASTNGFDLIDNIQARTLDLLSSYNDDDNECENLTLGNNRVIISGSYDKEDAENYHLEYAISNSLSLLEKDLQTVYLNAQKLIGKNNHGTNGQKNHIRCSLTSKASSPQHNSNNSGDDFAINPQGEATPTHGNNKLKSKLRTWATRRFSTSNVTSPTRHQDEDGSNLGDLRNHDEEGQEIDLDDDDIVKQGYLRKRSSKLRKTWKRRWFILKENNLYYIREANESPVLVCNCLLATVREADPSASSELNFCFEILSPNNSRTYLMQAESESSKAAWIDAIRNRTEKLITGLSLKHMKLKDTTIDEATIIATNHADQRNVDSENVHQLANNEINGNPFVTKKRNSVGSSGTLGDKTGKLSSDVELLAIQKRDTVCADCGASTPDWASINLGMLLCIECSGIHRSLGVHVSKVRSLTLDSWSIADKKVLQAIGNSLGNRCIWESDIETQTGWTKPTANAPRTVKERFIKAKYQWKGFFFDQGHPDHSDDNSFELGARCNCQKSPEELLHLAIQQENPLNTLWYIAKYGLNDQSMALHEAATRNNLVLCELILQNGGKKLAQVCNIIGKRPVDLATNPDVKKLLSL